MLVSIAVTPPSPSIFPGDTQQLAATGTYSDTTTMPLASVTWDTSVPGVATITDGGLATGVAVGATTLSATLGAVTGSTLLTVAPRPPAVTSAFPPDGLFGPRPTTPIVITFNVPMDPATLTAQTGSGACLGSLQLSDDGFTTCRGFTAAAPVLSSGNTVATLTPAAPLSTLRTYRVRVTTAVRSATMLPPAAQFSQAAGFRVATDGTCGASLLISQVYGAGGNTGAPLNADFVEIHNPGLVPVSLGGMALQYAAATGTSWQATPLPNVMVPPGAYFLVRISGTGTAGAAFTADHIAVPSIAIATGTGKVALTAFTSALPAVACPLAYTLDLVGYGTGTNCFEGPGPTPTPTTTTSVFRAAAGCTDANVSSADFSAATVAPRSLATAAATCACTANATLRVAELDFCNLQFPATANVASGVMTPMIFGRVFEAGVTEPNGASANVYAQLGYGAAGVNPATQPGFSWAPATFNVQVGNDEEFQASFTAPPIGTYGYTYRFSIDGTNWTVCDLNGAGANAGLTFESNQLGVLTVP